MRASERNRAKKLGQKHAVGDGWACPYRKYALIRIYMVSYNKAQQRTFDKAAR